MPTATSSSVLAAGGQATPTIRAFLLGRTTERVLATTTTTTMTTTISPTLDIYHQLQNYSSSISPILKTISSSSMSTTATIAATTTTTTMATPSAHDELEVFASPVQPASQYMFENLFESSGPNHYTALIHALIASFSVILVSELGDKTFIITAIMAMKNSRSLVFISSALALLSMTVLSVGMGVAVTVIPELYTHYASIVLFLCFGLKMLKESYDMPAAAADGQGAESEFDEVKRSLETESDHDGGGNGGGGDKVHYSVASGATSEQQQVEEEESSAVGGELQLNQADSRGGETSPDDVHVDSSKQSNWWTRFLQTLVVAPIVIKVFTMVFVAEWGDRSQISTVILAAREDVIGVFIGSLTGHVLCTGLAVIGGRFVADMISVRTMTLFGGIIFLFFAIFAILSGPERQL